MKRVKLTAEGPPGCGKTSLLNAVRIQVLIEGGVCSVISTYDGKETMTVEWDNTPLPIRRPSNG